MTYRIEAQTFIKGGLPVIAQGTIFPAEPDVGLDVSVDDLEFYWIGGGKIGSNVLRQITESEIEDAVAALLDT